MPIKITLLKPGTSQLLGQLIQVGLVAATWPAALAWRLALKSSIFPGKRVSQLPLF